MTEERVMDSVSGSIWGPPGPQRKERTMEKCCNTCNNGESSVCYDCKGVNGVTEISGDFVCDNWIQRKEITMRSARIQERKDKYHKKIMGELEAYVERPGEEWGENEEDAIIDMLDAVEHSMKAQLSSNDKEYTG